MAVLEKPWREAPSYLNGPFSLTSAKKARDTIRAQLVAAYNQEQKTLFRITILRQVQTLRQVNEKRIFVERCKEDNILKMDFC